MKAGAIFLAGLLAGATLVIFPRVVAQTQEATCPDVARDVNGIRLDVKQIQHTIDKMDRQLTVIYSHYAVR